MDKLFDLAFKGLVYPQIWEDPEVDMEALAITPDCHVVAIASGSCNILSYLIANPRSITAVDLSKAHVALGRLKLSAARHLPTWETFYRFFGKADEHANIAAYWRFLAPQLDAESRSYWEARGFAWTGRRRIDVFGRNLYRHGLLGIFIGLGHALARVYGVRPSDVLRARSIEDQRIFFDASLAPLFQKRFVRWTMRRYVSLYGLGIPPAQYDALALSGGGDMAAVLCGRMERLACGFSFKDNYFAWQAFGRAYAGGEAGPLPPYLRREHFDTVRDRSDRVEILKRSLTDHLATCTDASVDRFVLLDAQDWMSNAQLNALWREITRTSRPGARVIFRTAAEPSLLPGRLDDDVLERWAYETEISRDLTVRDRSAIYGGLHLYIFAG